MVHIGLFAILIFLWRSAFNLQLSAYHLILLFSALIYGLMVEYIQRHFVANRDFDLYDVVADMIGAVLGLLAWYMTYRKK